MSHEDDAQFVVRDGITELTIGVDPSRDDLAECDESVLPVKRYEPAPGVVPAPRTAAAVSVATVCAS